MTCDNRDTSSQRKAFCYGREHFMAIMLCVLLSLVIIQYTVSVLLSKTIPFTPVLLAYFNASFISFSEHSTKVYHYTRESFKGFDVVTPPMPVKSSNNSVLVNSTVGLPLCPLLPPKLVGPIKVWMDVPSWEEISNRYKNLMPGGRYRPPNCTSRHRVAIIVPYRDREAHLKVFLNNIHSLLQKQQLDYGIFVIEEIAGVQFNRAKLLNIGFTEAVKDYDYQCMIFHDIDLVPEDDRNIYSCPDLPRHMSVAIDRLNYKLPYANIFGGVGALRREQFELVNGFSNQFWGWGGEDDDMFNRLHKHGLKITRYPVSIARYKMLKHSKAKANPDRYKILYSGHKRFQSDGLSNLEYKIVKRDTKRLFTWVLVDIGKGANTTLLASLRTLKKPSTS